MRFFIISFVSQTINSTINWIRFSCILCLCLYLKACQSDIALILSFGIVVVSFCIRDCMLSPATSRHGLDVLYWRDALPGVWLNSQTKVIKSFSVMDLGKSRALIYSTDFSFISLGKHGSQDQESKKESGRWGIALSNGARARIYDQEERWMCNLRCILYHSPCPPFW